MKAIGALLAAQFLLASTANSGWKERDVQACVCVGMEVELVMPSGARADCISKSHVIEIDKTSNWAESIGQALHYSEQTGLPAKVILYCRKKRGIKCLSDRLRFESTVKAFNLPLELDVYGWLDLQEMCRKS